MVTVENITTNVLRDVLAWEKQHINVMSNCLIKYGFDDDDDDDDINFPNDNVELFYKNLSVFLNSDNGFDKYKLCVNILASKKNKLKNKNKLSAFTKTYFLDGRWFERSSNYAKINSDSEIELDWKIEEEPNSLLESLEEIDDMMSKSYLSYYQWWRNKESSSKLGDDDGVDENELSKLWGEAVARCEDVIESNKDNAFSKVIVETLKDEVSTMENLLNKYKNNISEASEHNRKLIVNLMSRMEEILINESELKELNSKKDYIKVR